MTDNNAYILRKLAYEISLQEGEIKKGMEMAYDIVEEVISEL